MKFLKTVLYLSLVLLLSQSCDEAKKGFKKGYEEGTKAAEETSSVDANKIPGWHSYNGTGVDAAWQIDNEGVISFDKSRGKGGDLVTDEEYDDLVIVGHRGHPPCCLRREPPGRLGLWRQSEW